MRSVSLVPLTPSLPESNTLLLSRSSSAYGSTHPPTPVYCYTNLLPLSGHGKDGQAWGKTSDYHLPGWRVPQRASAHRVTIEQMRDILERNGFVNVFLEPIPAELSEKDRKDFEHLGVWEKK